MASTPSQTDTTGDTGISVGASASEDQWIDLDGKRMQLSELLQERSDLRSRLAQVKSETRSAIARRRAEVALKPYQAELIQMQKYLEETQKRVIILFEGRDAAGKGGTIRRVTRYMNEKHYRVVALGKPTEHQRTQWFFQRYVEQFPHGGEQVLFDRSWYNRAMVERAMGFCSGAEVKEFLRSVPELERMLIRSGVSLCKFYYSVSKKAQAQRFAKRVNDPLRQWKLSPVDQESQDKWDEYTRAKEDMFFFTSTADSPWTIIKSDDKKRARINAMRYLLSHIDYPGRRDDLLEIDRRIVRSVAEEIGVED